MEFLNLAAFPLSFAVLWLLVTVILSFASGWFSLAARYPDRQEEPLLALKSQSGQVGSVSMRNILHLYACRSGLRVGIMRIFGPFSRNFFVPWTDIHITRMKVFFMPMVRLEFGRPAHGHITISENAAARLGKSVPALWPESSLPKLEAKPDRARRYIELWFIVSAFGAGFFTLASAFVQRGSAPPVLILILAPFVVCGLGFLLKYFKDAD